MNSLLFSIPRLSYTHHFPLTTSLYTLGHCAMSKLYRREKDSKTCTLYIVVMAIQPKSTKVILQGTLNTASTSCRSSALSFLGRYWFTQRILETRIGQMKIVCCGLKTVPTEQCAGMHAQFVRLVSIDQISVTTTDFSLNRTLSR